MTTKTEFRATADLTGLKGVSPATAEAIFRNADLALILIDRKDNGHSVYHGAPRGMRPTTGDDTTGSAA
jgi:hypothetical protein